MVQAFVQRLSRNLGVLPGPVINHQVLFMCLMHLLPSGKHPPQFHFHFLIGSCTCLSPSYSLSVRIFTCFEWIYSWKLLVFKFLSVAFIFYSFRKDIQGGTKTILLLLYPQWLTEYLFGTDASLNICLNEKRNRNLYRETPNKTRMGSMEGESWRQTYK